MSRVQDLVFCAVVILILLTILPITYYDMGYGAGVEDTYEEPNSLIVTTSVITLNATTYNISWYTELIRHVDQPEPTLRNDSFVIYVYARWADSVTYIKGAPMPRVNITVEVVPVEYEYPNYTIERVVLYSYNPPVWKSDSYYNNERVGVESVNYAGVAFFGYGSIQSDITFWSARSILFTVGPIWYEEMVGE